MRVYCRKHDNTMEITQISIDDDYQVIVSYECKKEDCENKINVLLSSTHTHAILTYGVEEL